MAARYWIQKIIGFVSTIMVVAAMLFVFKAVYMAAPTGEDDPNTAAFDDLLRDEYRGLSAWDVEIAISGDTQSSIE